MRLRQLREAKDMTQAGLAKRAGISRGYLIRLEAAKQDPTLTMLERLAKALGVRLVKLLE